MCATWRGRSVLVETSGLNEILPTAVPRQADVTGKLTGLISPNNGTDGIGGAFATDVSPRPTLSEIFQLVAQETPTVGKANASAPAEPDGLGILNG